MSPLVDLGSRTGRCPRRKALRHGTRLACPQPHPDRSAHDWPTLRELHAPFSDLLPILVRIGMKVVEAHNNRRLGRSEVPSNVDRN